MKIVFSIPGFDSKSNGLKVLHCLARDFQKIGAEVRILPWPNTGGFQYEQPEEYKDLYSARFELSDAIAFFPDAIPLDIVSNLRSKVKHCVWWLCNVPGLLGHGLQNFGKNDFLFAYSKLISPYLPQLYYHGEISGLPPVDEIIQKRKDADLVLIYNGKGKIIPIPRQISDQLPHSSKIIYISRFFPETKEYLYSLLSRAKYLISFDPISNLNYEATLFGVPVFLVNDFRSDVNMQKDFNIPQYGLFKNSDDFVNAIKAGLDIKQIHHCHQNALNTNIDRVKEAYDFLKYWTENSSDAFLRKFQTCIAPLYKRTTEYELVGLKEMFDSAFGSGRTRTKKETEYLRLCVEDPTNSLLRKKRGLFARMRNSINKKYKKFSNSSK